MNKKIKLQQKNINGRKPFQISEKTVQETVIQNSEKNILDIKPSEKIIQPKKYEVQQKLLGINKKKIALENEFVKAKIVQNQITMQAKSNLSKIEAFTKKGISKISEAEYSSKNLMEEYKNQILEVRKKAKEIEQQIKENAILKNEESKQKSDLLKQKLLLKGQLLTQMTLNRIKRIELEKDRIEERRRERLKIINTEIDKAKKYVIEKMRQKNIKKYNMSLLNTLTDEQLMILANENNLSLPTRYTRVQKIKILENFDPASSPKLKTFLILDIQQKKMIAERKRIMKIQAEINEKRIFELEMKKKINIQFNRDLKALNVEHEKANKVSQKLALSDINVINSQEMEIISRELQKTIEMPSIKDIKELKR